MAPALRQVQWPPKFKPEMPLRYDSAADPSAFLLAYEEAVLEAWGDDKVMANWLPMALNGVPRAWLLNLPGSTVASWEELRGLFAVRFAALAPAAGAGSMMFAMRARRGVGGEWVDGRKSSGAPLPGAPNVGYRVPTKPLRFEHWGVREDLLLPNLALNLATIPKLDQ